LTIDQQNSSFNIDYDANNNNSNSKSKFIIEERRRLVARLWAQSKSETEIARELHYNVSIICRDIKFLKKLSQQFVFDLAKDRILL
jgi:DNA-binding NarL/FixJ family response regulator